MDADKKTTSQTPQRKSVFKHWCVLEGGKLHWVVIKRRFLCLQGNGQDTALAEQGCRAGSSGCVGFETHTKQDKIYRLGVGRRHREEAAHGWTCGKKWRDSKRRLFWGNPWGSLSCFWNPEEVKAFPPSISSKPSLDASGWNKPSKNIKTGTEQVHLQKPP